METDIVKALERMAPQFEKPGQEVLYGAASLIESQEAEIERLSQLAMMREGEIGDRDREIERLEEAQRWIPVTERMPEDDKNTSFYSDGRLTFTSVLCVTHGLVSIRNRLNVKPTGTPYLDEQVTDGWVWGDGDEPTHWRELPEAPEKG